MAYFEKVIPTNIIAKFRDAFESFNTVTNWSYELGDGDLIYLDGNAVAASYLVISKNPLRAGSETSITSKFNFTMPVELSIGLNMSQRTLGQEFALEVIDTDTPLADIGDLAISTISQATTVLTVNFATPHNLTPGKSIGIYGCSTATANFPSAVVASIPSPTQITVTAGPGGNITSQTFTNPVGDKGFVYFRERLGRAKNGVSLIFENTTPTNGSIYLRSESGDALPSGTVTGNHSATVGTTAPAQLVNAAYTYSFSPTTEYRMFIQADRVQIADSAVDALAQTANRVLRTQVCPNPDLEYKFRIRAVNNKGLTVPNAQIVSASKAGTAVATITTDVPHGLIANDPVVIYGIRNQTDFANLVTAVGVITTASTTQFTVTMGATTPTTTSYGGYVAKINGGNLMSALGAIAQVAQSATLATLTDGTRQLSIVGSAAWAGLTIGDAVNVIGLRADGTGNTLNVDGAWKVANIATTTLSLIPLPGTTLPADFASTNCGGAIIKRTDMRLSFVRIFDFERQRVEMLARPASDISSAAPVAVQNIPSVGQSGTWNVGLSANQTLGTVTNQTNMGGYPGAEQIPALMRLGADALRRNITVT